MTPPASDFRKLCAEFVELCKYERTYTKMIELVNRADAALDILPTELTDEKLHEKLLTLEEQLWEQYKTIGYQGDEFMYDDCFGYALCDYHAVITGKGWIKSPQ